MEMNIFYEFYKAKMNGNDRCCEHQLLKWQNMLSVKEETNYAHVHVGETNECSYHRAINKCTEVPKPTAVLILSVQVTVSAPHS
jgi:hypothetical protein